MSSWNIVYVCFELSVDVAVLCGAAEKHIILAVRIHCGYVYI